MCDDETFDIEEIRGMTSEQLGDFLGVVFGLRVCMRLVVDRDLGGDVQIRLEQLASGTHPVATIKEITPGFIRRGVALALPAGMRLEDL